MNNTAVKLLTDTALAHFNKNIESITQKIIANDDNKWMHEEFEQPMFVEKTYGLTDRHIAEAVRRTVGKK